MQLSLYSGIVYMQNREHFIDLLYATKYNGASINNKYLLIWLIINMPLIDAFIAGIHKY